MCLSVLHNYTLVSSIMEVLMSKNVFVVGRHNVDLGAEAPNLIIVGSENVQFPLQMTEVALQLKELQKRAVNLGADAILFQNTPGILTATLMSMQREGQIFQYGVIISVQTQASREANVSKDFNFVVEDDLNNTQPWNTASDAVKYANGRAKTEVNDGVLTVTVDPVMRFEFDHVEWFS